MTSITEFAAELTAIIVTKVPGDTERMYIVATTSDNYKAIFSWNEIFNSPLRDSILVFYEKNGVKLDEYGGDIALISAKDLSRKGKASSWTAILNIIVRFVIAFQTGKS